MPSHGPVMLNGQLVYTYVQTTDSHPRLRLSVDEFDRLNLWEGSRIRISWPQEQVEEWLLLRAERLPPYVWLELQPLARTAPLSARAG